MSENEIKEWKLVYAPNNKLFGNVLTSVAAKLELDGIVGVESEEEIEAAILKRKLVAGIHFNHSAVGFKMHSDLEFSVMRQVQITLN